MSMTMSASVITAAAAMPKAVWYLTRGSGIVTVWFTVS